MFFFSKHSQQTAATAVVCIAVQQFFVTQCQDLYRFIHLVFISSFSVAAASIAIGIYTISRVHRKRVIELYPYGICGVENKQTYTMHASK